MNFANQALAQLRELFESMTPAARITSGLLLSVVVISLAYLVNFQASGGDEYLMGGQPISPSNLPTIQGELGKANLSYEMDGMKIKIPRGQHHKYMAALAEAGALPAAQFGKHLQQALDKGSTFESKQQKAARIKLAKQMELTAVINKFEGVQEASVFYDEDEGFGFNKKKHATALVNIIPVGADSFTAQQAKYLRKMVAAAYSALNPEDVGIWVNGRMFGGGGGDGQYADASENPYAQQKKHDEELLERKILNSLSLYPGVLVSVSAELNPEMKKTIKKQELDAQAVTITSSESKETKDREQGANEGPPGLASQQGKANAAAALANSGRSSNTKETKSETTEQKVPNIVVENIEEAGLVMKKAKVVVSVPDTLYLKFFRSQNKTEDGSDPASPDNIDPAKLAEELKKIQLMEEKKIEKAVAPLMPTVDAGEDQQPNVTVVSFHADELPEFEPPSLGASSLAWVGQNWGTLSMFGLAVFSLLVVRSMVKSTATAPTHSVAVTSPTTLSVVSADTEEGQAAEEDKPKRRFAKGPSIKDELAGMVREDPEAAATILKGWLATAG